MATPDSVFLEVTFKGPVEKIWEAWTNPLLILNWFGSDHNGKGLKAELDVQPGGQFEITFQDGNLTEHTCSGVYHQVEFLSRLTFTWQWKNEPGVESFITVLLTPEGGFTRMQFEHKHLGVDSQHDYAVGWQRTFSKLENFLERQARL